MTLTWQLQLTSMRIDGEAQIKDPQGAQSQNTEGGTHGYE